MTMKFLKEKSTHQKKKCVVVGDPHCPCSTKTHAGEKQTHQMAKKTYVEIKYLEG